jgi:outer membrane protein assembly factor BamC
MISEYLIIIIKWRKFVLLSMTLAVSGCSMFSDKVDPLFEEANEQEMEVEMEYETAGKNPPLEVPPDLTGPATDGRYVVPDLKPSESKTYSAYSRERANGKNGANTKLLPANSDDSMVWTERSGTQRWLVVKSEPETVWPIVKDFWVGMGFGIKVEIPEAGVIETDWAENIAVTPQNILLREVSTIERDKFRTRLERGESGTTEIYISHRGMDRPADPDLEAEILARLVVYFGVAKEQAKSIVTNTRTKDRAYLDREKGDVLTIDGEFDRSWRRVGLALDRIGFTVEDRDRSAGIYFVRYVDPDNKIDNEPGLWDNLLPWEKGEEGNKPVEYRIQVSGTESGSEVKVVNKDGSLQKSDIADRILNLLYEQLR